MSIDIDKPRYDQNTYIGRVKHFVVTTNPLNILASNSKLNEAKEIVENYRLTKTLPSNLTDDELWKAKYLMDSAFHPDTKEKMFFPGRMSFQVPGNLLITAGMLTFYKTTAGVVFFQVLNQSFNAIVNYTNRSGDAEVPTSRVATSFAIATTSATSTALLMGRLAKKMPPIYARLVPFCAVAAANCINLPFMRSTEIMNGIQLINEKNEKIGESPKVAKKAISQVVLSRVFMATPGMVLVPMAMSKLEKKYPKVRSSLPLQLAWQMLLVGTCLLICTPLCCAIFPQISSTKVEKLEPGLKEKLQKKYQYKDTDLVYYNKGL